MLNLRQATTKALSKGVVALQEEASEQSPKKHKGDDKCGTVTEAPVRCAY